MPAAEEHSAGALPKQRNLILCFDGTGNKFQGNESDTNVVKIYQMLEKKAEGQYHYYQPGIGTYKKGSAKSSAGGPSMMKSISNGISSTLDQAVGASFVDHVVAGYEFVMRYYQPNDHIYIFGFSRGAYTARFLAEMITSVGLLSKGNEEMVEFAWDTFAKFQSVGGRWHLNENSEAAKTKAFMDNFRKTFCREWINIHFIGLFDCVNSVGQFEIPLFRSSEPYMAFPPAKHIRHAISIHERRLKFKPALFNFKGTDGVDCKEKWFAGNHGDVGGGWGYEVDGQTHLLSDIALNWMLQEIVALNKTDSNLEFSEGEIERVYNANKKWFETGISNTSSDYSNEKKAHQPHDMLSARGCSYVMTLTWWILEVLPFFTRLELEQGKWVPRHWPPNLGAPRDLPEDADVHESVAELIKAGFIREEDIPIKGGDNSHFPVLERVRSAQARKKKSSVGVNDTTPLLNKTNGANGT